MNAILVNVLLFAAGIVAGFVLCLVYKERLLLEIQSELDEAKRQLSVNIDAAKKALDK